MKESDSVQEIRHFRKISALGRACSLAGIATGCIFVNPFSAFLVCLGVFSRWVIVAHHAMHGAYSRYGPGVRANRFGRGFRRIFDWFDFILPSAWAIEHNNQHHPRLGQVYDPDLVERNTRWIRQKDSSRLVKNLWLLLLMSTWRFSYYAANTLVEAGKVKGLEATSPVDLFSLRFWNPLTLAGRYVYFYCWLPVVLLKFVLLPALIFFFSPWAALHCFLTLVLAEWFTNIYSFVLIASNHTGDDLFNYQQKPASSAEASYRQIISTVNYRTGNDLNDFLHGWLNYHIEHHMFPDLTLLQYRRIQPGFQRICQKYNIPYIQEGVFSRFKKCRQVILGDTAMPVYPNLARAAG